MRFMLSPRDAALLLANAPTMMPALADRLVAAAGGVAEAEAQLRQGWCPSGMPASSVQPVVDHLRTASLEQLHERMAKLNAHILLLSDDGFPEALRHIPLAPQWLFVQGALPAGRAVAVVGSRATSAYGLQCAELFAGFLARSGITVVSGMAYGIDAAAHRAALSAGGHTVAVVGTGLATVYPTAHRRLSGEIAAHGAVVSEFPFDAAPLPWRFPVRNRLVSGMCVATIMIEAGEKSGSLITGRLAAEQGRDVFAVPADITRKGAWGCLKMLAQGEAAALYSTDQLAEALGIGAQQELPLAAANTPPAWAAGNEALWQQLNTEATTADALCVATGLPTPVVLSTLALWQVQGYIRQAPDGSYYVRAS